MSKSKRKAATGALFVSEQGIKMGRQSILHVRLNGKKNDLKPEIYRED